MPVSIQQAYEFLEECTGAEMLSFELMFIMNIHEYEPEDVITISELIEWRYEEMIDNK